MEDCCKEKVRKLREELLFKFRDALMRIYYGEIHDIIDEFIENPEYYKHDIYDLLKEKLNEISYSSQIERYFTFLDENEDNEL